VLIDEINIRPRCTRRLPEDIPSAVADSRPHPQIPHQLHLHERSGVQSHENLPLHHPTGASRLMQYTNPCRPAATSPNKPLSALCTRYRNLKLFFLENKYWFWCRRHFGFFFNNSLITQVTHWVSITTPSSFIDICPSRSPSFSQAGPYR
jgi:hypothetical protein